MILPASIVTRQEMLKKYPFVLVLNWHGHSGRGTSKGKNLHNPADGESLSDDALRGIWPGYEEEEEPLELF